MSGIVGIVNLDGTPVDRALLLQLTRYLAPQGPDAQEVWSNGSVGLGHAMLRTTPEAAAESQPFSMDGQVWITADCRVDARDELVRALAGQGQVARKGAPDSELILHAYAAWGENCVEHLLGDFAFAIWDGRRRTLFCARDHFGVKPFFYARIGSTVVFSNTLNCVRLHPAVPDDLDDVAIADFLVFELVLDLDRTSFSSVRRLPPSHSLSASRDRDSLRRYWEIPFEEEIRYSRRSDYMERFLELLELATKDRLRTDTVGVFMSGGLDSTSVAAMANRIFAANGAAFDLRAHTVVFDRIVPDEERHYSQLVADSIGIPIQHYPVDDHRFPPELADPPGFPPEPESLMDAGRTIPIHRGPAAISRVLLRGDGADPLLDLATGSLERSLRLSRIGSFLRDFVWLAWKRRAIPRTGVRTLIRKHVGRADGPRIAPFPDWLAPDLERRLDARARWRVEAGSRFSRPGFELAHAYWACNFESHNPGGMGLAAEMRYPFVDVRLASYLLRLPPFPWAVDKSMLRLAMKGMLPDAVLRRPKAPTAGNPWVAMFPADSHRWWEPYLEPDPRLHRFVDVAQAAKMMATVFPTLQRRPEHRDIDRVRMCLRPISLNLWLRQTDSVRLKAYEPVEALP